jgi:hypothetical protein
MGQGHGWDRLGRGACGRDLWVANNSHQPGKPSCCRRRLRLRPRARDHLLHKHQQQYLLQHQAHALASRTCLQSLTQRQAHHVHCHSS